MTAFRVLAYHPGSVVTLPVQSESEYAAWIEMLSADTRSFDALPSKLVVSIWREDRFGGLRFTGEITVIDVGTLQAAWRRDHPLTEDADRPRITARVLRERSRASEHLDQ